MLLQVLTQYRTQSTDQPIQAHLCYTTAQSMQYCTTKKDKGSPYSITERRVPELIPVLGSQPAGDVSHKPGGRLPLFFARPAVTPQPLRGLLPILLHDGCEQFA